MTDITNAFEFLLELLWYGVSYCFSLLDSITFYDISLLRFIIAITIIGAVFSVIFSVVHGSTVYNMQRGISRGSSRGSSKRSKSG